MMKHRVKKYMLHRTPIQWAQISLKPVPTSAKRYRLQHNGRTQQAQDGVVQQALLNNMTVLAQWAQRAQSLHPLQQSSNCLQRQGRTQQAQDGVVQQARAQHLGRDVAVADARGGLRAKAPALLLRAVASLPDPLR